MQQNKPAWRDAYNLHTEALVRLDQMDQEPFWSWYHDQMQRIAQAHNNNALILALLYAVFEDLEHTIKERENKP